MASNFKIVDVLKPKLKVAAYLLYPVLMPLAMTIRDKTGYDALNSNPMEFSKELSVPALFLVAENDNVALPKKVHKMFDKYGSGKKKLHIMKGREHADDRRD